MLTRNRLQLDEEEEEKEANKNLLVFFLVCMRVNESHPALQMQSTPLKVTTRISSITFINFKDKIGLKHQLKIKKVTFSL